MKLIRKHWLSVLALVMTLFIGAFFVMGNYYKSRNEISASVRTIHLSESEVDYQAVLNEFEDSELIQEGSLTTFTGYQSIDSSIFDEIDNVSESEIKNLSDCKVFYEFSYDSESNIVTIYASMENEYGELEIDTISGVGFINEDNEIDAVMNIDGEGVLLSEMRNAGMIQNCGWFSSLIKAVVVVAVATAVVAATVAVCVATAGVAAPALVAVGVGVTTAKGIGIVAGLTVGAIFYSTVGTAALQAGVITAEEIGNLAGQIVDDASYSNPLKAVRKLSSEIISKITSIVTTKIYQFAYLHSGSLIIMPLKMNYLEAYAVLVSGGLINLSTAGALSDQIEKLPITAAMATLINTIRTNKDIIVGLFGIYTPLEENAAKLAYAAGGFFKGNPESEIHNKNFGSGYYYHFHDFTHSIHVWYGKAA